MRRVTFGMAMTGAVGITRAEVDDVFPAAARGHLHLAGDVEDAGREALEAGELFHGFKFPGIGNSAISAAGGIRRGGGGPRRA